MSQQISVTIGGKSYRLTVPQGQESRLKHVASQVDEALREIKQVTPDMDRDQQVVLTTLKVADDLLTCKSERDTEQKSIAAFNASLADKLEKILPKA